MLQKDYGWAGMDQGDLGSDFSSLSREDSGLDQNGNEEGGRSSQILKFFLRGVSKKNNPCLDYRC